MLIILTPGKELNTNITSLLWLHLLLCAVVTAVTSNSNFHSSQLTAPFMMAFFSVSLPWLKRSFVYCSVCFLKYCHLMQKLIKPYKSAVHGYIFRWNQALCDNHTLSFLFTHRKSNLRTCYRWDIQCPHRCLFSPDCSLLVGLLGNFLEISAGGT